MKESIDSRLRSPNKSDNACFVNNRALNVERARSLGMHAIRPFPAQLQEDFFHAPREL